MKGIAVGILLFALAGTGTVMAQNHNWRSHRSSDWRSADSGRHTYDRDWRRGDYVRHDNNRGCRDRRGIYSDIRRDERPSDRGSGRDIRCAALNALAARRASRLRGTLRGARAYPAQSSRGREPYRDNQRGGPRNRVESRDLASHDLQPSMSRRPGLP